MQKFRVWELAKQYNKTDKDIISTLKSHNVEVKSHLSVVDGKAAASSPTGTDRALRPAIGQTAGRIFS